MGDWIIQLVPEEVKELERGRSCVMHIKIGKGTKVSVQNIEKLICPIP